MALSRPGSPSEADDLLRRAADGDPECWGTLWTLHAAGLRRLVAFRMDQRLLGRIDPSDVADLRTGFCPGVVFAADGRAVCGPVASPAWNAGLSEESFARAQARP